MVDSDKNFHIVSLIMIYNYNKYILTPVYRSNLIINYLNCNKNISLQS